MVNPQPRPDRRHRRSHRSQCPSGPAWRSRLYEIIFEADTPAGRGFDVALLVMILTSVAVVSMETVPTYQADAVWMRRFVIAEWALTILFSIEYVLRLICVKRPLAYAFSFWGVIDLLSILPSFLTLLPIAVPNSRSFVILRSIRLLRVFRILKLWRMMDDADELSTAIWRARGKIVVFLAVVMVAVTISGTLMYFIETELHWPDTQESDFTSIPQSMYWAIVTMTTVGYGDVVAHTAPGKLLSAALILLGYSLIIVPTGFVSAEFRKVAVRAGKLHVCPVCQEDEHLDQAEYCCRCGGKLV